MMAGMMMARRMMCLRPRRAVLQKIMGQMKMSQDRPILIPLFPTVIKREKTEISSQPTATILVKGAANEDEGDEDEENKPRSNSLDQT